MAVEKLKISAPIFPYKYLILLVCFFCMYIYSGFTFLSFSLFTLPLEQEFGWSRSMVMLGYTITLLIFSAASPLVGRVFDRFGAKPTLISGALVSSAGFLFLSTIDVIGQFYAAWAIIGIGFASIGIVPVSALISNWFTTGRGFAIGSAATGIGLAGLTIPPVFGGILIPGIGWSLTSSVIAGMILLVILPLALFIVKTRPPDVERLNLDKDDTVPGPAQDETHVISHGVSYRKAITSPVFWLISICYFLFHFSQVGIVQNQVPFLQEAGFPTPISAASLGIVGVLSGFSKIVFGWITDRISPKVVCATGLLLNILGISLLFVAGEKLDIPVLWLSVVIIGISMGSWLPTMAVLTSKAFGLSSYGAIFGTIALIQGSGNAIGPFAIGLVYDITHSYYPAFILAIILSVIAIPIILSVRQGAGDRKSH